MAVVQTQLQVSCLHLELCNPAVDDPTVTDNVIRACPAGTYSTIFARTEDHHFSSNPGIALERSRLVQFKPTNYQAAWNILSIIFQRTNVETLNLNRVGQGLLGSQDPRDQHYAQSAYWQNYTIKVYVSMAGAFNYDIEDEQGAVTQKVSGICVLL
jgi:hypothetical protein